MKLLSWVYHYYNAGYTKRNALFRLHRAIIKNPLAPKLLFDTRVDPSFVANGYFDLTTLLLTREILKAIGGRRGLNLQELGSRFAIRAGYMLPRLACSVSQKPKVATSATMSRKISWGIGSLLPSRSLPCAGQGQPYQGHTNLVTKLLSNLNNENKSCTC